MIKDSQNRRGISDKAAREKERREIIVTIKASHFLDDIRLYTQKFGGLHRTGKIKSPPGPVGVADNGSSLSKQIKDALKKKGLKGAELREEYYRVSPRNH